MRGKKSEQIKIYMTIGLLVAAAVVAYFRFVHKNAPRGEGPTQSAIATAPLDIPKVENKTSHSIRMSNVSVDEPLCPFIRDIFSPVIPSKKKVKSRRLKPKPSRPMPSRPKPSKPPANLKLTGVIVGGENPIAIINGQFVRTGERIGKYRVVRIGEKEVFIRSGNRIAELKLLTK